jgi:hypothetical protein
LVLILNDLKAHVRVDTDIDDALLQSQLDAATAYVNKLILPELVDNPPAPVRQAILVLAAQFYMCREITGGGGLNGETLPFNFLDLIEPYRNWDMF